MEISEKISFIAIFSFFRFSITILSHALIIPMSQLQTQQLMMSHIEYLTQTFSIILLILHSKLMKNVDSLTVFNIMIIDSCLVFWATRKCVSCAAYVWHWQVGNRCVLHIRPHWSSASYCYCVHRSAGKLRHRCFNASAFKLPPHTRASLVFSRVFADRCCDYCDWLQK